MIDVVLDTNIIVAALRSSLGASYRLLQTLEAQTWRPVVSPTLVFEYEAVLKRQSQIQATKLTLQDIDDVIGYLCSRSRLVQIYFRWRPTLPDPNDDHILELAVQARSDVVTFNTKDFAGSERFGIRVLKPRELLAVIGAL